jgi:cytochrome c556
MRSTFVAAASVCVLLIACNGWKTGQANSSQGNISQDNRPPATAKASKVTSGNAMIMLAVPSVSGAQAAAVMKARHDGMESMGKDLKTLHRDLDSDDPNTGEIRSAAADILKQSKAASNWFPAGTGPEAGKTGAKPEIWQNPQDFAAKLADFQKAAGMFYKSALVGDVDTLKANEDTLAGTCKACHDKYRAEMKH